MIARLRVLLFGVAELRGGPFNGTMRKVPRLTALGLMLPQWGAVIEGPNGYTQYWPWGSKPDWDELYATDSAWRGSYDYHHLADHFHWAPTGLERPSEWKAA